MKKNISSQVNDWATQRKQAIEKSKQLRDDRKYNLALAGEMSVGSASSSTTRRKLPSLDTQNRVGLNEYNQKKPASAKYGVSLVEYMPSEEEQMQAKSSLKLLKSKMRDVNGNPLDYYPERQKSRGYIDEETHEYMPYAPGERALEQDYDFNDVFHSGNPNYRKVFKPVFVDHNYPNPNFHMNRETFHQDQVFHKKASLLAHANRFGPPRENLHPPVYEPPQRVTEENNRRRPPLGGSRFATKKGTNYTASSDDFSEIQSQNIPSRRPQQTIGSAKDKRPQMANSYEDAPKSQFSKQKYQSNKAPLVEENNMDTEGFGYNNYSNYEYDPEAQYRSQAKPAQASKNAQKKVAQDFNYENNEKEEKPATFSKPNFKKKAPAKPKSPAKQDSKPLEQHELANLGGTVPAGANDSGEPLIECPEGCGRKFTEKVLEKHAKVCQKVFQSKRKKFDSAQQRADGLEEAESDYPPRKGQKPPAYNSKSGAGPKKVPKWKAESEAFRASMQAARS